MGATRRGLLAGLGLAAVGGTAAALRGSEAEAHVAPPTTHGPTPPKESPKTPPKPSPAKAASPSPPNPKASSDCVVVRGTIAHFKKDPGDGVDGLESFADGALVMACGGAITWVGDYAKLPPVWRRAKVVEHRAGIIVPGFVDARVSFAQADAIGSPGAPLLDWLTQYGYPAERKLDATSAAKTFLDALVAAGTTTAAVAASVSRASAEALLTEAKRRRMRMICGKILADRAPYAPSGLADASVEQAEKDTRELIKAFHGQERLTYALSPRFAPSSSEKLLEMVGRLFKEFPTVRLVSQVAADAAEVELVRKLWPSARSYLDVYDKHGLVAKRAVYAGGVHLDDRDRQRMGKAGAALAFCPAADSTLGAGLFDLAKARGAGVTVGLGTGPGAGYSLLRTIGEAAKVAALRGQKLSALRGLYLATLGSATALGLDDTIGSFAPGKEADFVILDPAATPALKRRTAQAKDLAEKLAIMASLGADHAVKAAYVNGELAHDRDAACVCPPAAAS